VGDPAAYEQAAVYLRDVVRPLKKEVEERYRPRIKQAHDLHAGLMGDFRQLFDPLVAAEKTVAGLLTAYDAKVEADRLAREEDERLERERIEAQAKDAADATNKLLAKMAEDDLVERAAAAEQAGDVQQAARIMATPVVVPTVAPTPLYRPPVTSNIPAPPRVSGVSTSVVLKAEVANLMDLVRAVAAGHVPLMVTMPNGRQAPIFEVNESWLNAQAKAQGKALKIPGVKVVEVRGVSVSNGGRR
jgi:hypothetical protein